MALAEVVVLRFRLIAVPEAGLMEYHHPLAIACAPIVGIRPKPNPVLM
jgi:hypothetical protein